MKSTLTSLLSELRTNPKTGLSHREIDLRQMQYGKNVTYFRTRKNPLVVFLMQFASPLIIVLSIVSVMSIFVGDSTSGLIILAMLCLNAVVGSVQEMKAEKSLEKLSSLVSYNTRVLREGKLHEIPQAELVPGDIVYLKTGDVVPADIRLLAAKNVSVNESTLTGESLPVFKEVVKVLKAETIIQENKGTVFMGTAIVGGHAQGVVVNTGKSTELGEMVGSATPSETKTKFERDLQKFSDLLLKFVLIFSGATGIINVMLGRDVMTSLMLGITLALGITPEILPIVVTIAMSSGAFALAKKKVIVRRLASLEDLGNVDILCTDKTGTLTTGEVTLKGAFGAMGAKDSELSKLAYYCSAAYPTSRLITTENPLDEAIEKSFSAEELKIIQSAKILDVDDFDFVTKRMRALTNTGDGLLQIEKGATELLLRSCAYYLDEGKVKKLTLAARLEIINQIDKHESKGDRVISLATLELPEGKKKLLTSLELVYRGFLVFHDPPRFGVKQDIDSLDHLAIHLKILTGDSAIVTKQVAKTVDLAVTDSMLISGEELGKLDENTFSAAVEEKSYFVRVSPIQKQQIIEVLKAHGHAVGYIGDGINDVGALRAADVGISVDSATPVTKDVSDLILLDRSLSALKDAVIQGRKTFSNTIKFITNTMSSSFGNVLTAAVASMFLPYIPLLPAQLLLIDSLSDMQHLSFATDNVDKEMYQKPRSWNSALMNRFILVFGSLSTAFDFLHMGIFASIATSPELFRTLWFIESVTTEMLATFSVRTTVPFFKSRPSRMLLLTTVISIALAVLVPLSSIGTIFLGFSRLAIWQYGVILLVVGIYIFALEITKKWFYKQTGNKGGITGKP